MTTKRETVKAQDKWNTEALYPTMKSWETHLNSLKDSPKAPFWPKIASFQGRLHEGPKVVKEALTEILKVDRELSKLCTYAHLKHDEDITNDQNKQANNLSSALFHQFTIETSWFDPELLALPNSDELVTAPELADYRFHLEKVLRVKKHTLKPDQEHLLALSGKSLEACIRAFSAINDADFKFDKVADSQGNFRPLTHGSYSLYIRDQDRFLRKNAFYQYHTKYDNFQNTLCELLKGNTESHVFNARARHFSSSLEAALYPKNIDVSVYHSLVKAVNEEIDALYDYYALREEILGVGALHLYDMYVPLTKDVDIQMTYDQAVDTIIASLAPLGKEYQATLEKGFKSEGWVDKFENENKRSGAYSSGCYDSYPYMLMNYKNILRDVFTLTHEAGHSMHSYYTKKNQPYIYGSYPIFLAEVASTFNEELLLQHLLKHAKTKEEKIFLVNQKIEDIRGTLFRQTMFAEFELKLHEMAEKDQPITPASLKEVYLELNKKYFGPKVVVDEEIAIEWARIPHFYYNFYVYQYATGISAALALSERVLKGGDAEREAYLNFLKSGCSKYPIQTLKDAGVDMTKEAPVKAAIGRFRELTKMLRELTK
jgi:oligoendopeptidase F